MSDEITKVEIQAMINVQAKSAEHLALIAKSLSDIVSREEKIHQRLYNGLGKEIVDGIAKVVKDCDTGHAKEVLEIKTLATKVSADVAFLKWIYGGLFALIGFAWLILQVVEHVAKDGVLH